MRDLMKLHKVQGGNGTNLTTYVENSDEHFNLGELFNVVGEDNKLKAGIPTSVFLKGSDFVDSSTFNREVTKGNVDIVDDATFGKVYSFNGSNSYLNVLEDLPIEQDFTIDFWVNIATPQPVANSRLFMTSPTYSTATGLNAELVNARTLRFFFTAHSVSYTDIDISDCVDKWSHMAFTRKGDKFKLFINGKLRQEITFSTQLNQKQLWIGNVNTTGSWFKGKICNFRVMNYAVWTEEFTPVPSMYQCEGYRISPPIKLPKGIISTRCNWEGEGNIELLNITNKLNSYTTLFIDGAYGLEDLSENPKTITKYGTEMSDKGIIFDGVDDYLSIPLKMDFSKPFTIEGYMRVDTTHTTSHSTLFSLGHPTGTTRRNVLLYVHPPDKTLTLEVSAGTGGSDVVAPNIDFTPYFDKNLHISITYDLINFIVHIDGKEIIRVPKPTGYVHDNTLPLLIGKIRDNNFFMKGEVFRVKVSNVALYNGNYTPSNLEDYKVEYIPLKKNGVIRDINPTIRLKEVVKYGETISNVNLEIKHKPKKDYVRPVDLVANDTPKTVYLYNEGNECTDITGGWNARQYDSSFTGGHWSKQATYLQFGDTNSNGYGYGGFVTARSIDLTDYTTMKVKLQMVSYSGDAEVHVTICNTGTPNIRQDAHSFRNIVSIKNSNKTVEVEVDISTFTGEKWIGCVGMSGSYSNHMVTGRLHSVQLIK